MSFYGFVFGSFALGFFKWKGRLPAFRIFRPNNLLCKFYGVSYGRGFYGYKRGWTQVEIIKGLVDYSELCKDYLDIRKADILRILTKLNWTTKEVLGVTIDMSLSSKEKELIVDIMSGKIPPPSPPVMIISKIIYERQEKKDEEEPITAFVTNDEVPVVTTGEPSEPSLPNLDKAPHS